MGRIFKTTLARNDLLANFIYLGERNFDAATRFLVAFDDDCRKLAEMPGMGVKRNFIRSELSGVRSWTVTGFENYLIFYRPVEGGIEILRVVHGARDLENLFGTNFQS